MTQPKRKKDERAELVKLYRTMEPGDFVKVLENGIQSIIEAEPYQRVDNRTNYRNGYRERKEPLSTGLGPINLSIPKLRTGSFYPSILEQYQRVDRALISIISEAYFADVSTRKMDKLFVVWGCPTLIAALKIGPVAGSISQSIWKGSGKSKKELCQLSRRNKVAFDDKELDLD